MEKKFFKVSSGLKNLIGSELITDNFVAVFELVKNSFDAQATEVRITFEDIYGENAKITIQDNGKGMTKDDLTSKWLFLGYSAKRDGTEDDDYRNKIKSHRVYAGAKGVGRFSCDRLGRYLNLTTISRKANSKIENIFVDWAKFEKSQKTLFQKIPIEHSVLRENAYGIKHGTVLEITGVQKDFWSRDNFKRLKERLSKLVRPDLNTSDEVQKFKIILTVPDEIDADRAALAEANKLRASEIHQYYNTINGEIKNFVFNELDIKTTKIESSIDNKGIITTKLLDRENFIYEIKEKSDFDLLSNIKITLYFLNRSAKVTFHKRTGVEHVDFGSLFIYKNGFRVYPYGERGDDSLRLENRALQGYARFIGLRSLIGEISIGINNPDLRETTSRGDGLVRTRAYDQLVNTDDGFLIKTLRRLEKYVVDVTQWGVNSEDENIDISSKKAIEGLVKLVANISDKQTIELKYNRDILNLLTVQGEKSAPKLVQNFKRIAAESNDKKLYKEAEKIEKAISSSLKRATSAEKERDVKVQEKRELANELEIEKQKNIYLSVRKPMSEDAEKLIHSINFNLVEIDEKVIELIAKVKVNNFSKAALLKQLTDLKFFTEKSRKISEIATRANYKYEAEQQWIDIPTYLKEYLSVYNDIRKTEDKSSKIVEISINSNNAKLKKYISPIEIAVLVDNLISNAIKWRDDGKKTSIQVDMRNINPNKLEVLFSDNGKGLLPKFVKIPKKIFELGVTETKGSGIGLNSAQRTMDEIGGKIEFAGNHIGKLKGACFKITINK
ncbi:MAG: ATP-binding protein [Bacteroidota bacterium]